MACTPVVGAVIVPPAFSATLLGKAVRREFGLVCMNPHMLLGRFIVKVCNAGASFSSGMHQRLAFHCT